MKFEEQIEALRAKDPFWGNKALVKNNTQLDANGDAIYDYIQKDALPAYLASERWQLVADYQAKAEIESMPKVVKDVLTQTVTKKGK